MSKIKIGIATFLICLSVSSFSQNVQAVPDRNKIFIGEQIQVKITAENISSNNPSWFYLPDTVNHLEVIERGKIDTVVKGNFKTFSQIITITSFDSGVWKFPALILSGSNKVTMPFSIQVLPVDVSKLKDYNEIKDIIEVPPGGSKWWITCIIAFITLLALVILIWLFRLKRKTVVSAVNNDPLTPLQRAMEELTKLEKVSLQTKEQVIQYYAALVHISRTYFDRQMGQKTFYSTTDEWMIQLQSIAVDNDTKVSFFQLLRLADTVKFAKYLPDEKEHPLSVAHVRNMILKSSMLNLGNHSKYQPAT